MAKAVVERDKRIDFSRELMSLTADMISRIRSGGYALSMLEKKLLDVLVDKRSPYSRDPNFVLRVCQYFRGALDDETSKVWEFAINMKTKLPPPLPSVNPDGEELMIEKFKNLTPSEREEIRDAL